LNGNLRLLSFAFKGVRERLLESSTAKRYFSSLQIGVATLIGGPLAGGYLASRDHALFGAPGKGRWTLLASAAVVVGLIYFGSLLSKGTLQSVLPFVVAIAYRVYAQYAFDPTITERRAKGWVQFSWWRTAGISLAFLMAILALALAAVSLNLS
jgi:hypothetical protein